MSKPEFQKTQGGKSGAKGKRIFGGKGFFVALAVSLVAVGGAVWFGVDSAMNKLSEPTPTKEQVTKQPEAPKSEWTLPNSQTNQVAAPKNDVPDTKEKAEIKKQENTAVVQGYILPIKGEIINGYSGEKVVKSKTLDDWVMHTGLDISAAVSTPVKAMSGGKVVSIENDDMWGTTVKIQHENGYTSFYANLKSAVNVKKNQVVKMGDVIGAVGETCDIERAEPSHLHFGVLKNSNWIDPFSVIK